MTIAGWIFMTLSWLLIIALMVYTYARILNKDASDKK